MSRSSSVRPSIADLKAAGVWLRPADAATIAHEVAQRAASGVLPGIPSSHVLRFEEDGDIAVEGPVASGREIERAARLLESLLPGFDAPPGFRVPGALRLVVARALGVLDVPPFESLDAFAEALSRFAEDDAGAIVRDLVSAWRIATAHGEFTAVPPVESPLLGRVEELTISDIRRARRATRLTLTDIADRTHINVERLRELEWGYLANWPTGIYGRAQLLRYARAAGLDEHIVTRVVLPLLEQWDRAAAGAAAVADVDGVTPNEPHSAPEPAASLVPFVPRTLVPIRFPRRQRGRWALAAAVPLLLAVAILPSFWIREETPDPPTSPPVAAPARSTPSDVGFTRAVATRGSAVFHESSGEVLRVTRVVDERANNFHARPSPDGTQVAFDSDRDGERGVYVANADGSAVRRVSGVGFAALPSWSPDGRTVAFVRAEPQHPDVWNIWAADLETRRLTRITAHDSGQPWGASWFPDGMRIAYDHDGKLVVRTVEGSRETSFAAPVAGRNVRAPAVAPDGRRVIVQVEGDGAWLIDVTTGRKQRILSDPSAEEFVWSPEGDRFAYYSGRSGTWGVRVTPRKPE